MSAGGWYGAAAMVDEELTRLEEAILARVDTVAASKLSDEMAWQLTQDMGSYADLFVMMRQMAEGSTCRGLLWSLVPPQSFRSVWRCSMSRRGWVVQRAGASRRRHWPRIVGAVVRCSIHGTLGRDCGNSGVGDGLGALDRLAELAPAPGLSSLVPDPGAVGRPCPVGALAPLGRCPVPSHPPRARHPHSDRDDRARADRAGSPPSAGAGPVGIEGHMGTLTWARCPQWRSWRRLLRWHCEMCAGRRTVLIDWWVEDGLP